MVGLAEIAPVGLRTFSIDLLAIVESLPKALINGLIGLVQLTAMIVPFIAAIYLLVHRRFVLLSLCSLAALLAALSMVLLGNLVEESVPLDELGFDRVSSWFIGTQFPSSAHLTAALVAASPWLAKAWRQADWILVLAAVVARALTATEVPLRNAMLLAIDAAAGSAALVIVDAPRRRLDPLTIRRALLSDGLDVGELRSVDRTDGAVTFVGADAEGAPMLVRASGRDQRDTDLLLRFWRNLTVKGLTSDSPLSPKRTIGHGAPAMGLFRAAGVSTPRPPAVVETPDEAAVLAASFDGGRRMSRLDPAAVSGATLDDLW